MRFGLLSYLHIPLREDEKYFIFFTIESDINRTFFRIFEHLIKLTKKDDARGKDERRTGIFRQ